MADVVWVLCPHANMRVICTLLQKKTFFDQRSSGLGSCYCSILKGKRLFKCVSHHFTNHPLGA
ncbi:MAG: hypothetical protein AAGK92_11415, partial [Pseudomonadota bacterium]